MRPDKLGVEALFQKERQYVVPLYQRAYVWNRDDQWLPLWEDVERQAEASLASESGVPHRTHFLGAVVLSVQRVVGSSVAKSDIIDGQQRLTTLQILVAALRDYATSVGSDLASRFGRLTLNEYEASGSDSGFKVWPTNADRKLFGLVTRAASPDVLRHQLAEAGYSEDARIPAAYFFFFDSIASYAAAVPNALDGVWRALRSGLQLVVIELEDGDDPQIIFETLNARGQPLLPSDLIRNMLFHQASLETRRGTGPDYADHLYSSYWRPFDDERIAEPKDGEDRYWHVEERQGRLTRPRIDLFLFHFLVMQTGRELSIGQLFQEFRDWRDAQNGTTEDILRSLSDYAVRFRKLLSPTGIGRLETFARRLRSIDTSTVYPLLLFVSGLPSAKLSPVYRAEVLTALESWMVRRFVCQLTNKNYNKFFVSLLVKIKDLVTPDPTDNGPAISAAIREELSRSTDETLRWPSDEEFLAAWQGQPIYVKSRPDRVVMLLSAVDQAMRSSLNEHGTSPEKVTVEHLLPQKWKPSDYPLPAAAAPSDPLTPAERREQLIHSVGNLTLVTQALNSTLSNGPFSAKRPTIAINSDLRLNTQFQDPALESWLEADISERATRLFAYARQIWPRAG